MAYTRLPVDERRAQLLGVKEAQARFRVHLAERRTRIDKYRETSLGWSRKVRELAGRAFLDAAPVDHKVTKRLDRICHDGLEISTGKCPGIACLPSAFTVKRRPVKDDLDLVPARSGLYLVIP